MLFRSGVAQLERVHEFVEARRTNYRFLADKLQHTSLRFPSVYPEATPSWFGFPITLSDDCDFDRDTFVRYLNQNQIGTRLLFAGNATKQPFLKGQNYRVQGDLRETDRVMNNTLWLGVQPALTQEMLEYVAEKVSAFMGDF